MYYKNRNKIGQFAKKKHEQEVIGRLAFGIFLIIMVISTFYEAIF